MCSEICTSALGFSDVLPAALRCPSSDPSSANWPASGVAWCGQHGRTQAVTTRPPSLDPAHLDTAHILVECPHLGRRRAAAIAECIEALVAAWAPKVHASFELPFAMSDVRSTPFLEAALQARRDADTRYTYRIDPKEGYTYIVRTPPEGEPKVLTLYSTTTTVEDEAAGLWRATTVSSMRAEGERCPFLLPTTMLHRIQEVRLQHYYTSFKNYTRDVADINRKARQEARDKAIEALRHQLPPPARPPPRAGDQPTLDAFFRPRPKVCQ